jgi:hypothetical protein
VSAQPDTVRIAAPFAATPKQQEVAHCWHADGARVVTVGGAIRSGKTQAAGRLLVETAVEQPAVYLVARSTYRELEDSTKKAMLHGDGALAPLIPPELIDSYRASDNVVKLKTGAEILFRSLEETNVGKLLNLTLGGVFVDQIEELDGGDAGERIFDTLLGRLSDPRGPRKLLAVANPAGLTHWVYRRLVDEPTRDPDARYVHVTLTDNAHNLPDDYVRAMLATGRRDPPGIAPSSSASGARSKVRPFLSSRMRSTSSSPSRSLTSGSASSRSTTARTIRPSCSPGPRTRTGTSSSSASTARAGSSRSTQLRSMRDVSAGARGIAGPTRVSSPITGFRPRATGAPRSRPNTQTTASTSRRPTTTAQPATRGCSSCCTLRPGGFHRPGHRSARASRARRAYVFHSCRELIRQLKSAPIAADGIEAGEAVDKHWEGEHGHAVAAARYGAMSRPGPSSEPDRPPEDPRARLLWEHERKMDSQHYPTQHYEWR